MNVADALEALITATYSREMQLRFLDGTEVRGRIKGRVLRPVCGDRVKAKPLANEPEWLITEILPRTNQLDRPNRRGGTEVLAANVGFMAVMAAVHPAPDWFIVDRYLAAAELMAVRAAVIYNKTDLPDSDDAGMIELKNYASIGYKTFACSTKLNFNLDKITALFHDRVALLVGQSGVGKSSFINALVGTDALRVGALSSSTGEGKHTTVNSMLVPLPDSGWVIDSPGVRDYAPALRGVADVDRGFIEILSAGRNCRFSNCRHLREPGCAVKSAVDDAQISNRRYASYKRLCSMSAALEKQQS